MSSNTQKRLHKDLKLIQENFVPGAYADLVGDDVYAWNAVIFGPGNSCYEGGTFRVRLQFPPDYPNRPPSATFFSPMFHPNVYTNGLICLDILQKDEKWSPTHNAASVLFSIQAMLGNPNPDWPANSIANDVYRQNMDEFVSIVKSVIKKAKEVDEESQTRNCNLEPQPQDAIASQLESLDLSQYAGNPDDIRKFLEDDD